MLFNPSKGQRLLINKLLILGLVGLSQLSLAVPATTNDIRFTKGSIATTVEGVLSPKQDSIYYNLPAEKGQYAVINMTAKKGVEEIANVGVLHMPSGKQDGGKGGIVYQGCLPESGIYKLRIARNLMATNGGKAGYKAEIVVLPKYASEELCD